MLTCFVCFFRWIATGSDLFWDLSHEALARESNAFYVGPQGVDLPETRRRTEHNGSCADKQVWLAAAAAVEGLGKEGELDLAGFRRWLDGGSEQDAPAGSGSGDGQGDEEAGRRALRELRGMFGAAALASPRKAAHHTHDDVGALHSLVRTQTTRSTA